MSTFANMRKKSKTSLALLVCVATLISYQLILRGSQMSHVPDVLVLHDTSKPPPPPSSGKAVHAPPSHEASNSTTPPAPMNTTPSAPPKDQRTDCEIVQQMKEEKIVVVMRTGATESYIKLPMQLLTTLRCFEKDEFLLYSDVEDTMADHKIKNILAKVPETTISANPDFVVYQQLQAYKNTGQELSTFPVEMSDTEHPKTWTLDKYKFMHMLEDTYYSRPDGKWYVFIETDTYMVWSNVLRYLRLLDSAKPLYLGSAAQVLDQPFAHGGSGFIISRPALEKLFGDKERGWASTWDEVMITECCGDFIVGLSLTQAGVPLHNIWPMINGEYPATMPFESVHWCQPIFSMHHIPPPEMSKVWSFEQERGYETPMQIKDLYTKFIEPQLHAYPVVQSWDNLSDDIIYRAPGATEDFNAPKYRMNDAEKEAHQSGQNCELVCKSQKGCFQWLWKSGTSNQTTVTGDVKQGEQQKTTNGIEIDNKARNTEAPAAKRQDEEASPTPYQGPSCSLSKSFKLGKYARGKENQFSGEPGAELWVSGWDLDAIDKWVAANQCEPRWVVS